eukprot:CAMPEP_0170607326 /NCGR_PEP_ID=MMETSP0224-20130122/20992_1 /TAXON_ID=285029 /ORGANISM="Togula jolla, Strain CCCM 725" /LENGTH=336 /DNA_ID=CAMNT_0010932479 /DNA_START=19 /DNA_END=1029 /DNA_ORIENTATION=-
MAEISLLTFPTMYRHLCHALLLLALSAPSARALFQVSSFTSQMQHMRKLDHKGALIPPFMIVQRACTGSSVVFRTAKNLLAELGVAVYPSTTKELARPGAPEKNPWYRPDGDLGDAMRRAVTEASDAGQVLIFNTFSVKPSSDDLNEQALQRALLSMDTRTVIVHRQNPLDIVTCEIRDCFKNYQGIPEGYPVDEKGQKDETCFARRNETGESAKTKAYIDLEHLPEFLRTAEQYPTKMKEALEELGFKGRRVVYYEDLVSHEYSVANLGRSSSAWKRFLSSLGLKAEQKDIENVLRKDVGKFPPPGPHSEVIYNLPGVKELLASEAMSRGNLLRG